MPIFSFLILGQIDASQSLFTYQAKESPLTFMDLDYVPMFIDNITWTNDSFRQQAESVCGNNTNCLFDVAVTIDTSFGAATKKLEEDNHQMNNKLGKYPAANNCKCKLIKLKVAIKKTLLHPLGVTPCEKIGDTRRLV